MQRLYFFIELAILNAAPVVELDNFFQRLMTSIVHVWACVGNLAQAWRLKPSFVLFELGYLIPAEIGVGLVEADTQIVIVVGGQVEARGLRSRHDRQCSWLCSGTESIRALPIPIARSDRPSGIDPTVNSRR